MAGGKDKTSKLKIIGTWLQKCHYICITVTQIVLSIYKNT